MNATTKWTLSEHTVGVDLGNGKSVICRLNADIGMVERQTMSTARANFAMYFRRLPKTRVVLEVARTLPGSLVGSGSRGTRSSWKPIEDPRLNA